jgi:hypothetical protein
LPRMKVSERLERWPSGHPPVPGAALRTALLLVPVREGRSGRRPPGTGWIRESWARIRGGIGIPADDKPGGQRRWRGQSLPC